MRRIFPFVAIAVVSASSVIPASSAAAQRSTLVVHVADEGGHALSGARVAVAGTSATGATNGRGEARISGIEAGTRMIEVTRVGYALARVAADFAGGTVEKSIAMTSEPVEVEGVTATASGRSVRLRQAGFYERQRRGNGAFMTGDELMAHPPRTLSDAFRRIRGYRLDYDAHTGKYVAVAAHGDSDLGGICGLPKGGARRAGTLSSSSSGSCQQQCLPLVYVDGMQRATGSGADQARMFESIAPADVEAIEAYGAAEVPSEYNATGSACGVILIWMRGAQPDSASIAH